MLSHRLFSLLFLVFSCAATAADIPPLVDAGWLRANLNNPDLVVLDIQPVKPYKRFHVPGAVNAPYSAWRTKASKTEPGSMLPASDKLAAMIGSLGIGNDSQVLIVDMGRGASDLSAATRVFWTFKVLGHDKVSVLDGGLIAAAKAGIQPARGSERRPARQFRAKLRPELIPDADAVAASLQAGALPVDARSEGEFLGIYRGGDKERPGTIPGAKHLPHDWVSKDGSGEMRSKGALQQLFAARDIDPQAEQIHFCASGNRAALTWFAAYAVFGNEKARLYDGSMHEWAPRKDLPIETAIEICEAC